MSLEFAFMTAAAVVPGIGAAHAAYQGRARRRTAVQTIVVRDEAVDTRPILSVSGGRTDAPVHHDVVRLRTDRIVEGDLTIDGSERFRGPLKITGDLEVTGHATFDGTVVVNGYVSVAGGAVFADGLLCKADLSVTGHARFGTDRSGSWCIARRIRGSVLPAPFLSLAQGDDGAATA